MIETQNYCIAGLSHDLLLRSTGFEDAAPVTWYGAFVVILSFLFSRKRWSDALLAIGRSQTIGRDGTGLGLSCFALLIKLEMAFEAGGIPTLDSNVLLLAIGKLLFLFGEVP